MPKYCNFCREMVYTSLCPYCERPVGELQNYDDERHEPEVNEGTDRWAGDGGSFTVLDFDEIDGEFD